MTPDSVESSYSSRALSDGIEVTETTTVIVNVADLFDIEPAVSTDAPGLSLMSTISYDKTGSVKFTINNTYKLSGSNVLLTNVSASYQIQQTGITVSNTYLNYICTCGYVGTNQKVTYKYFKGSSINIATGFKQYVPDSSASIVRSTMYATLSRGTSSWNFAIHDIRWS